MASQVIETKYLGPTNTKGSRITAWTESHRITIPYPNAAQNVDDAHLIAATVLLDEELHWNVRELWHGVCKDGRHVFVPSFSINKCIVGD
jgi:hypothetical protein